jgi:predicted Zn finger-like uncharacterized protein
MNQQPKTVVCASCNAKFHVPDDLIRGKLVKFRCRKCGSAIDVDGRRARPAVEPAAPAPPEAVTDTPATFSQRSAPPSRPPAGLTKSSPQIHPWPEPPRTRSTMPPMALAESIPPEGSLPPFDTVSDPSNRGPKIAAVVALLIAAGLSGVGLAMRGTPPSPGVVASQDPPKAAEPPSPRRAHALAETKGADPSRPARTPTAVTDLPLATDSIDRPAGGTAGGVAVAAKAAEAIVAKLAAAAPSEALSAMPTAAPALEVPPPNAAGANAAAARETAGAPVVGAASEGTTESSASPAAPAGTAVAPGIANPVPPVAGNGAPAASGVAAVATGASPPAVAPPAGARGKGDFNTQAAREALEDAAARAARCKTIDTPSGTARIAVTFAPSGQATNAIIESGPFVGTAAGTCVAAKFKAARVPPFSGDSVQVHKSVPF